MKCLTTAFQKYTSPHNKSFAANGWVRFEKMYSWITVTQKTIENITDRREEPSRDQGGFNESSYTCDCSNGFLKDMLEKNLGPNNVYLKTGTFNSILSFEMKKL